MSQPSPISPSADAHSLKSTRPPPDRTSPGRTSMSLMCTRRTSGPSAGSPSAGQRPRRRGLRDRSSSRRQTRKHVVQLLLARGSSPRSTALLRARRRRGRGLRRRRSGRVGIERISASRKNGIKTMPAPSSEARPMAAALPRLPTRPCVGRRGDPAAVVVAEHEGVDRRRSSVRRRRRSTCAVRRTRSCARRGDLDTREAEPAASVTASRRRARCPSQRPSSGAAPGRGLDTTAATSSALC